MPLIFISRFFSINTILSRDMDDNIVAIYVERDKNPYFIRQVDLLNLF